MAIILQIDEKMSENIGEIASIIGYHIDAYNEHFL